MLRNSIQSISFLCLVISMCGYRLPGITTCCHGKSPMDGIGGSIKWVVFTNIKSNNILSTLWKSFQAMQTKGLIVSHRCTFPPIKPCVSQNRFFGFKNAGDSESPYG